MKIWLRLFLLTAVIFATPAFAQVIGGPVINGGGGGSGSVTSITAGSSNIVINPSTLTTTGTIDLSANPSVTSLTTSGDVAAGGGIVLSGTNSATLSSNGVIEYLNPNLRFSLPSTESYYFYNQGRGTNLLLSINGSSGLVTIPGALTLTGTGTLNGPVVATSTVKGFPFPEIALNATTTDLTGTITPSYYSPGAGTNAAIGIGGYALAGTVSGGTVNMTLTGLLPPIIPQGTLYLRQRYLSSTTTGVIKATISDAVVTNTGNPFTASLTSETQISTTTTSFDTFSTVDTALSSTPTANGVVVINYVLNQTTSPGADWGQYSLVIK